LNLASSGLGDDEIKKFTGENFFLVKEIFEDIRSYWEFKKFKSLGIEFNSIDFDFASASIYSWIEEELNVRKHRLPNQSTTKPARNISKRK
jgi:hypothetical protein